jgi:hypothetical protein
MARLDDAGIKVAVKRLKTVGVMREKVGQASEADREEREMRRSGRIEESGRVCRRIRKPCKYSPSLDQEWEKRVEPVCRLNHGTVAFREIYRYC